VATVTLNRPDVHNAMNQAMRRELLEVFTRLRGDDTVRAVVVTGAGDKAFSAGADIREFLEPPVPTQFREARRRVDFRREMERCPQPIIAAIRGYAFGGGLGGLACGPASPPDAQLGLTEIPACPRRRRHQRLPRLVGRGKALEMILTGMRIPAAEAPRIG
jgi:enoyl-CoA hydratase